MSFPHAQLRPRLLISIVLGIVFFIALPGEWRWSTRFLISWDGAILVYLGLATAMARTSSTEAMRERAQVEDENALAILVLTVIAAVASLAAIAVELYGVEALERVARVGPLTLAGLTILCSWIFVHTIWAIHYAHEFYGDEGHRGGLRFPHELSPDYWDFLYFSFNVGAAAQTSDVTVVSRKMRRLVLGHTVVAFLFNTTILALAVNVGAGLI